MIGGLFGFYAKKAHGGTLQTPCPAGGRRAHLRAIFPSAKQTGAGQKSRPRFVCLPGYKPAADCRRAEDQRVEGIARSRWWRTVGATTEAAAILMASPGKNGTTQARSAGSSGVPVVSMYHAVPNP